MIMTIRYKSLKNIQSSITVMALARNSGDCEDAEHILLAQNCHGSREEGLENKLDDAL